TLETYPQAPYRAVAMVRGAWSDLAALAGRLAGGDWTVLDLLAAGEQTILMIGCEGRTRNEIQDLDDAIRGAGATIKRFEQEETRQAREWMAQWLAWNEAPIIVRLVVSPGTALEVAGRVQALCFSARGEHEADDAQRNAAASHPADSHAWSCRLQVHPGAGLIRVAFMAGYREPSLRRLLLAMGEAVREAKGYRALDRAPEPLWWGWDVWGTARELRERMRRVKLVFDPRGILCPGLLGP
ncbi:MAG: hypothetical protein V1774_06390, partial [Candidatus Eisenbacteria bacterium]